MRYVLMRINKKDLWIKAVRNNYKNKTNEFDIPSQYDRVVRDKYALKNEEYTPLIPNDPLYPTFCDIGCEADQNTETINLVLDHAIDIVCNTIVDLAERIEANIPGRKNTGEFVKEEIIKRLGRVAIKKDQSRKFKVVKRDSED